MLSHMQPRPARRQFGLTLDARIAKLVDAADLGEPLEAPMLEIAQSLGFDSFMYGMCLEDPRPNHESRTFVWTTLPREWVQIYDRKSYVEVDPRLTHTWNRTAPYIWDSSAIRGEWQVEEFLRDAAQFGIRSGVVVSFRDSRHARIVVALNSAITPVSARRQALIQRRLGDIILLAMCFHDLFMANFVDEGLVPHQQGTPLSPRERQCLRMAARGMTSSDIGTKLGITERTANFHFSNLITKLGVLNRHEAIARAITTGIISLHDQDN